MSFLERRAVNAEYYHRILNTLKTAVQANSPHCSLLIYGSNAFQRSDLKPGISDIDGILYFNADVVTDKKLLRGMNEYLIGNFNIIRPSPMSFLIDIAVVDKGIANDGRYIPYGDSFNETLHQAHDLDIIGNDFRKEINLVDKVSPLEIKLGSGLNSLRRYILFESGNQHIDKYNAPFRCMQILLGLGRKVASVADNQPIERKAEGVEYLKKRFPKRGISAIEQILSLNQDIRKLTDFLSVSSDKMYDLIAEGTTAYEEILIDVIRRKTNDK